MDKFSRKAIEDASLLGSYRDDEEPLAGPSCTPIAPASARRFPRKTFIWRFTRMSSMLNILTVIFYTAIALAAGFTIKSIFFSSTPLPGKTPSEFLDCLDANKGSNSGTHMLGQNISTANPKLTLLINGGGLASLRITQTELHDGDSSGPPEFVLAASLHHVDYPHGGYQHWTSIDKTGGTVVNVKTEEKPDGCVREDLTLAIPPELKELHIVSHSTTQIKFDPEAKINLGVLSVSILSSDPRNALFPSNLVTANITTFKLNGGWLFGSSQMLEKTSIITDEGNAVGKLYLSQAELPENFTSPSTLHTSTGSGRMELFYERYRSDSRPITSTHISDHRKSQLHLDYVHSQFTGKLLMRASSVEKGSYRSGGFTRKPDTLVSYVGEKGADGLDTMTVYSSGKVGLFFDEEGK